MLTTRKRRIAPFGDYLSTAYRVEGADGIAAAIGLQRHVPVDV